MHVCLIAVALIIGVPLLFFIAAGKSMEEDINELNARNAQLSNENTYLKTRVAQLEDQLRRSQYR